MPIDLAAALGAEPSVRELSWTVDDVLLYHLSLGAGAYRTDPAELRWTYERALQVLPTFALVAGERSQGVQAGRAMSLPGIDVDLRRILHGGQAITLHGPIPTSGTVRATSRIAHVWDKGKAAVIVLENAITDLDGAPLWTTTSQIWARGEGGFNGGTPASKGVAGGGGEPGPERSWAAPDREPDAVLDSPTSVQTAMLYRLNGDRNPLHVDPEFARAAGLGAPILHGLASYGIVCKAIVDELLDGDASRVGAYTVRFAGMLTPGETIRTRVWRDGDVLRLQASCPERDEAPVLTHAELVLR
jgi:acyl dehydratase